ncbi:MAG: tRNA dihydrouridine synthase [Patescibacteria group bacterium]
MKNVWSELKKPIVVLAPMYDVTDFAFREIVCETAKPDVLFTEFVNVEALYSKGREVVLKKLKFSAKQSPVIAQVWGTKPENFEKAAAELNEMGFAGVDLNMGCPQKSVMKLGLCAGLINDRTLAHEIISATKEGAKNMPVSVKTRLGINEYQTKDWIGFLLEHNLNALTIHGRTVKDMSKVLANWGEIKKAVELRNSMKKETVILGNGDVLNRTQAEEYCKKYKTDGVMIGRGIFLDMWAFARESNVAPGDKLNILKNLLVKHLDLYAELYKNRNYNVMKKYFKIYIKDFDGSKELKDKLMETKSITQAKKLLQQPTNPVL